MTVSLRLAFTTGPDAVPHVIDVDAPPGTPFGVLREHIGDRLCDPAAADGVPLTDASILGDLPLVDGAVIEPRRDEVDNAVASPLRLVVAAGPAQGISRSLTSGDHLLGREHALLLGDSHVSRRHALVTMTRGGVQVTDLGSSNGTRLDGCPLQPGIPHVWRIGQHLRLGLSVLRLDTTPEGETGTPDGRGRLVSPPLRTRDPETVAQQIVWPQRPPRPAKNPMRWVAALAPVPVAVVMAFVLRSPLMLAFMAVGPLTVGLTHLEDRRRGRTTGRSSMRAFVTAKAEAAGQARTLLDAERLSRSSRFPPPDITSETASGKRPGLGHNALGWPLELRLGHGESPSVHSVVDGEHSRRLMVDDAPVAVSLAAGDVLHLDTTEDVVARIIEHLVGHLLVGGAPQASGLVVISPSCESDRWVWCRDTARLRVCQEVPDDVLDDLTDRSNRPGQNLDVVPIIVLDARAVGARELLRRWGSFGAGALLWVGAPAPELRRGAPNALESPRHHTVKIARGHRASILDAGHRFTFDEPPATWFLTTTRLVRRWSVEASGNAVADVPTDVRAHELLPPDIALAWREGPRSDVPIGRSAGGPAHLDLVRSGPHALVAGTTGAGKSEFLLAYLRGLFTLNSPRDVTALLIDYKGGATFGALADAPHVVGLVTDLDDGLANRALIALRAEIKRREHYLAERGHSSYTAFRADTAEEDPLPRLFVIVDEFRVLAEELPEFVSGLVRLAAVGRSLGMHLVLATQRPGGAVTADMRANLDVRVALRVRERADSLDVIDSPAASKISPQHPGRAYIAHAGSTPLEVQTAYTAAPRSHTVDDTGLHVHAVAPTRDAAELPACRACRPGRTARSSDLQDFVAEAGEAAVHLAPPRRPLLPPLPEQLLAHTDAYRGQATWSSLLAPMPRASSAQGDGALIAVADLPHDQSQPAIVPEAGQHIGLAGAPRSGRTHAAWCIADAHRCLQHELWWVGDTPPGSVDEWFRSEDPNEVVRLLSVLSDSETAHDSTAAPPTPVTIVIDGWESLHDNLIRINHGLAADEMLRHVQRAHQFQRTFVITGGRLVLASKLAALLEVKIVMRQNDQTEYSLAGLRPAQVPTAMPAGRGLVLPHAHVVQFVTAAHTDSDMTPLSS